METLVKNQSEGVRGISLEAGQQLLQMLVDNIKEYAILTLDPEGFVTTWTPTAERLKGYKAEEIIGTDFSTFFAKEDVESGKCNRELEVAARDGRSEDEGWRVRKDGTRFGANVVVTALRDANGNLKGFGKVTRDLTDRKEAEERIRSQSRQVLEMATVPVVQVWEGILLVPLIGMLDSARTQQLMERLLQRLTETGSPGARSRIFRNGKRRDCPRRCRVGLELGETCRFRGPRAAAAFRNRSYRNSRRVFRQRPRNSRR